MRAELFADADTVLVLCHGMNTIDDEQTFAPQGKEVGFYAHAGEDVPTALVYGAISSGAPPIEFAEEMPNYRIAPAKPDEVLEVQLVLGAALRGRVHPVLAETRLCSSADVCLAHARELGEARHHPDCTGLLAILPERRLWFTNCRRLKGQQEPVPMTDTYSDDLATRNFMARLDQLSDRFTTPRSDAQLDAFQALPAAVRTMLLQTVEVENTIRVLSSRRQRAAGVIARDDEFRDELLELDEHPRTVWFDGVVAWAFAHVPARVPQARALAALDAAWLDHLDQVRDRPRPSHAVAPHDVQTVCEVHREQLPARFLAKFSARLRQMCAFADLCDVAELRRRGDARPWQQIAADPGHPVHQAMVDVGAFTPGQFVGVTTARAQQHVTALRRKADSLLREEIRRWYAEIRAEAQQ